MALKKDKGEATKVVAEKSYPSKMPSGSGATPPAGGNKRAPERSASTMIHSETKDSPQTHMSPEGGCGPSGNTGDKPIMTRHGRGNYSR